MPTDKWCCAERELFRGGIVVLLHHFLHMQKFLFTFYLPERLNDDFWASIPAHRRHINRLMDEEVIVTYSVNRERSKGWIVLNAESMADACEIIERFPLRSFIRYEAEELFIFDSMIGAPRLILN